MTNQPDADDVPASHHPRDELVEDARWLATTLAETHPDPYDGHGGRVDFHRRLAELVREIPEEGEPVERFHRRVQAFAAQVRDGHTKVESPEEADEDVEGRFPLRLRVVGTELYVEAAFEEDLTDLLGGRLVAVDGVPVAALRERVARVESADNRYGDLLNLAGALGDDPALLEQVLDDDATAPTVTVETTDGERVHRVLESVDGGDPTATLDATTETPETSGEPAYRFLDDGETALLSLPDGHSYRELHELVAAMDADALGGIYDTRSTYRRVVGEPVPEDPEAVLAGLPAVTEVLADLFEEMAATGTDRLVVDVRGNNGGSSLFAYALVHAVAGWDGVVRTAADQFSVSKDSELYREEYGDEKAVDEPTGPANLDCSGVFDDPETVAAEMRQQFERSETFADALAADPPGYRPDEVTVVTNARTFSAGLEPAVLLAKLGANVVGVPSGQSPNGPRDTLFTDLPNTGLELRVSYRHHEFQPGTDGTALDPDDPLTPERFEMLGRPGDAALRLAIERATSGRPSA